MSYWDKILDGFDFKTKAGAPSNAQFKNPNDRMLLRMELLKKGWPENVVNEYLYEIDLVRKKQDDGTYGSDYAVKQFNPGRGQKLVKKDASAQDVKKALGVKDDDDLQRGKDEKPKRDGQKLAPIIKYDIQCMSIGFLADQQTPMIWRGPMVTSAIKTFTQKVNWNNLDFIIVDMPPGTGDTQLTFSQEIKMDGAIIVSTPQEVALLDVKRGIKMFDKLGVKILGLVDNMSYFTGDDGKKYKIFGEGGVKRTAEEFNKEFLGDIPINPEVGKYGDEGKPIVEAKPDHEISKIYLNFAKKIRSTYLDN